MYIRFKVKRMKKGIIAISVLVLASACSQKTAGELLDDAMEGDMEMPTAEIAQGKMLYESKCVTCHAAKQIDNYTVERWAVVLPNMAEKAKLDTTDTRLVGEYIDWELHN